MKDNDAIILEDDLGNTVEFSLMDVIGYLGREYVVLLPCSEDADEFMILLIDTDDSGDEIYVGIDDDDTVSEVFEIFKERHDID